MWGQWQLTASDNSSKETSETREFTVLLHFATELTFCESWDAEMHGYPQLSLSIPTAFAIRSVFPYNQLNCAKIHLYSEAQSLSVPSLVQGNYLYFLCLCLLSSCVF